MSPRQHHHDNDPAKEEAADKLRRSRSKSPGPGSMTSRSSRMMKDGSGLHNINSNSNKKLNSFISSGRGNGEEFHSIGGNNDDLESVQDEVSIDESARKAFTSSAALTLTTTTTNNTTPKLGSYLAPSLLERNNSLDHGTTSTASSTSSSLRRGGGMRKAKSARTISLGDDSDKVDQPHRKPRRGNRRSPQRTNSGLGFRDASSSNWLDSHSGEAGAVGEAAGGNGEDNNEGPLTLEQMREKRRAANASSRDQQPQQPQRRRLPRTRSDLSMRQLEINNNASGPPLARTVSSSSACSSVPLKRSGSAGNAISSRILMRENSQTTISSSNNNYNSRTQARRTCSNSNSNILNSNNPLQQIVEDTLVASTFVNPATTGSSLRNISPSSTTSRKHYHQATTNTTSISTAKSTKKGGEDHTTSNNLDSSSRHGQQQQPMATTLPMMTVSMIMMSNGMTMPIMMPGGMMPGQAAAPGVGMDPSSTSFNQGFHPAACLPPSHAQMSWTCTCGQESGYWHKYCGMCATPQNWICADCDYQLNLCTFKFCSGCGTTRKEKSKTTTTSKSSKHHNDKGKSSKSNPSSSTKQRRRHSASSNGSTADTSSSSDDHPSGANSAESGHN